MIKYHKPFLLFALALFLCRHLVDGTILFYINRSFVRLIWLAVVILFVVVISYWVSHTSRLHTHRLTWRMVGFILLPILLGGLVPPQPLGTAALSNRNINAKPQTALRLFTASSRSSPSSSRTNAARQRAFALHRTRTLPTRDVREVTEQHSPTLLDWVLDFGENPDPAAFNGQQADLTGFVYRRAGLPPDTWFLSRFIITCCVADAMAVGLVVRAPDVAVVDDMWVQVRGHFVVEIIDNEQAPVLVADSVLPIDPPAQPYLYFR